MLKEELESGIGMHVTDDEFNMMNDIYMTFDRFADHADLFGFYSVYGLDGITLLHKELERIHLLRDKRIVAQDIADKAAKELNNACVVLGVTL